MAKTNHSLAGTAPQLQEIYVILIADEKGNFNYIHTYPQSIYATQAAAEQRRWELIAEQDEITEVNSKVQKMYKIIN